MDGEEDTEARSDEESGNEGDDENTEDTEREPRKDHSSKQMVIRPISEVVIFLCLQYSPMVILTTSVFQLGGLQCRVAGNSEHDKPLVRVKLIYYRILVPFFGIQFA